MAPKKKVQTTLAAAFAGKSKELATDLNTEAPAERTKRSRETMEVQCGVNLAETLVEPSWQKVLAPIFASEKFAQIESFLAKEYAAGKEIFPPKADIFAAFNATPFDAVNVVLIGQDPYHDDGQAHGLCFSVKPGIKPPPSLANMYKELATDIPAFTIPSHGYLMSWAKQGVLMLNASLTVEAHQANSHAKCGWQDFTSSVIDVLNKQKKDLVFLLWGGFAQKKGEKIDVMKHYVIKTAHPSPLSAKQWFGCKTFSKCNQALEKLGKTPIDWSLPPEK